MTTLAVQPDEPRSDTVDWQAVDLLAERMGGGTRELASYRSPAVIRSWALSQLRRSERGEVPRCFHNTLLMVRYARLAELCAEDDDEA
jgi:hypothetical protein